MSNANDKLERIRELLLPSEDEVTNYHKWNAGSLYYEYFSLSTWECKTCIETGDTPQDIQHSESCMVGKILEIINE